MVIRPDASIYSQVLIAAPSFSAAASEAAAWLEEHAHDVTMIEMTFRFGDSEELPIEGRVRFTDG